MSTFRRPVSLPARKIAGRAIKKRFVLNGLGAPLVAEDFGSMGAMGFDINSWATDLWKKTVDSAQTSVTKAVVKTVQNTVLKLTGTDGKTTSITMTPDEAERYRQDGTIPSHLLPKDFKLPPKSFMQEYGAILKYTGIGVGALAVIVIAIKMIKKK
jgi:hypothetical protein